MKQHKFLKITISLILLIALITAASIFLSYNVLTVRTFSYETDKAVDPVRAVVISDLHEHELGKTVAGWASTVCIVCFMGGIQLLCLGVIGEYIGKIYLETKRRPRYIISERTNSEDINETTSV